MRTGIDFALRIGLASDDPGLRAVALRAYLSRTQQLEFELQAPPGVQKLIDEAQNSGNPDDVRQLIQKFRTWV